MDIDRPIFLLGPGRAGSTVLHNLLTHHRDVGCFISWSSRYPRLPFLAFGSRLRSGWLEKKDSRIKYYPGPTEPYEIWRYCFPDFWRICGAPCRDTDGAAKLRRLIASHLAFQGRSRFVAKLTGAPMLPFLESLFPDVRLVWLDRDPRAVSYSYFLRKTFEISPGTPVDKTEEERLRQAAELYLRIYGPSREFCGDHYVLLYEDFIADPVTEMRKLLDYAELRPDAALLRLTAQWPIRRDANEAWRKGLRQDRQDLLDRLLERPLRERGYLAAAALNGSVPSRTPSPRGE